MRVLTFFWFSTLLFIGSYFFTSSKVFALASGKGIFLSIKGAYDYGQEVNDGTSGSYKASNVGYSGEGLLGFTYPVAAARLGFGGFYFYDSSKTYKIKSSTSTDTLQNFSISPKGYGVDVNLRLAALYMRAGYGWYTADGRRVVNYVGRDYEVSDGTGIHAGIGLILGTVGMHPFLDVTYRQIAYKKVKLKSLSGDAITLDEGYKWNQKLLSIGGGIMLSF
ncbi:MAG: hypothetical protein HQK53_08920 [Oligoflexia bacterium]|nr:hypothetical protein [Oligoflexia bacterium]